MLKNCQVRCKQIQEQISKSLPMTRECTEDLKWLNSVHLWLVLKEKSSYLKLCIHNGISSGRSNIIYLTIPYYYVSVKHL